MLGWGGVWCELLSRLYNSFELLVGCGGGYYCVSPSPKDGDLGVFQTWPGLGDCCDGGLGLGLDNWENQKLVSFSANSFGL